VKHYEYDDLGDDEEEDGEAPVRRARHKRAEEEQAADARRYDAAVECCRLLSVQVGACLSPFMRLPCCVRLATLGRSLYKKRARKAVHRAYEYMSAQGGVLRFLSLVVAAAGWFTSVVAVFTKDGGLFETDYIGMLLALYCAVLQATIVMCVAPRRSSERRTRTPPQNPARPSHISPSHPLIPSGPPHPTLRYEWPGARFYLVQSWVEVNAVCLSRLIGRGLFILFVGALAASNFSAAALRARTDSAAAQHPLLTVSCFVVGTTQMSARGAAYYLPLPPPLLSPPSCSPPLVPGHVPPRSLALLC
jgi:hypothetical protein